MDTADYDRDGNVAQPTRNRSIRHLANRCFPIGCRGVHM